MNAKTKTGLLAAAIVAGTLFVALPVGLVLLIVRPSSKPWPKRPAVIWP
jgi:hypothetical protein